MTNRMTLEELVALTDEEIKAELTLRGLPAEGPREALRELLHFSGRVGANETDTTNLITVDDVNSVLTRGEGAAGRANANQQGSANADIAGQPRHHSSPNASGSRYHAPGMTAYDILRKWDVKFTGAKGEEIDAFLTRIEDGRKLVQISDSDLLNCIPLFLSGLAYHWYKIERPRWSTWTACTEAMLRRFGDPDFQWTLREEIRARTQGNDEPVTDFLTCMRNLFVRAVPPISEDEQLNIVHRNMLPRLQVAILRTEIRSLEGLEVLASRVERSFRAAMDFHAPPAPERSMLPEFAYHGNPPPRRQVSFGGAYAIGDFPAGTASQGGENTPEARLAALEMVMAAFTASLGGNNSNNRPTAPSPSGGPATPVRPVLTATNPDPLAPVNPPAGQSPGRAGNGAGAQKAGPIICRTCGQPGHYSRGCAMQSVPPRRAPIYCFRCGKEGETTRTEHNCPGKSGKSGNADGANH